MTHIYKLRLLLATIAALFLLTQKTNAQWQWGKMPVASDGISYEAGPVTTDLWGNVYTAGTVAYLSTGDTCVFGTTKIIDTGKIVQLIITKSDPSGTFKWAFGTQGAEVWLSDVRVDYAGNVFVMGDYLDASLRFGGITLVNPGPVGSSMVYFLAKLDSNGNPVWAKNLFVRDFFSMFGETIEYGDLSTGIPGSIVIDGTFAQDKLIIGTDTLLNSNPGSNNPEIFVARYDTSGNPMWARKITGHDTDYAYGLAATSSGDIFVGGNFNSPTLTLGSTTLSNTSSGKDFNMFIAKYDALGNVVWAKTSVGNCKAGVRSMAADDNGNVYATGQYFDSLRFNSGPYKYANFQGSLYLVKFDALGNYKWLDDISDNSIGYNIAPDQCGNLWVSGSGIAHTTIFYGSSSVLLPLTLDPMFVAEYDTAGTCEYAMALPSGGDDFNGIAVDNRGNMFVCGDIYGTTGVTSPDTMFFGHDTLTSNFNDENLFLAKYQYSTSFCYSFTALETPAIIAPQAGILVYPNPASTELNISAPDKITDAAIYNLVGQTVYTHTHNSETVQINIAGLSPGVYFIKINGAVVRKFVKE